MPKYMMSRISSSDEMPVAMMKAGKSGPMRLGITGERLAAAGVVGLSIDGRTNFVFMVMWGVLGVAWIKLLLPRLLKLINLIPWNWRYAVTVVCAGLMLVDGVMTVQSIDCWYARSAGKAPDTPIEEFYAKHFDNAYMEHRFQTMTMDVNDAARADR